MIQRGNKPGQIVFGIGFAVAGYAVQEGLIDMVSAQVREFLIEVGEQLAAKYIDHGSRRQPRASTRSRRFSFFDLRPLPSSVSGGQEARFSGGEMAVLVERR
jgi:hypothetical protein